MNVSNHQQAEESLRDSEARLQRAETVARFGHWEYGLADRMMRASAGAQRIYGLCGGEWTLEQVQSLPLAEYRPLLDERFKALIEQDQPYSVEFQILRPSDGQVVDIHSIAEYNPERRIVFGVIRDITEAKRAEREKAEILAQLIQAQKMESLGTLAGGISHDMNNVLGAILGLATANLELQPPGSAAYRAFDIIAKAATRGGNMVRGLLSFARQSRGETRELDLNALLLEEIHLLEHTTLAKVRLALDLAPDLRPIRGDASALAHAFMNLCINAVDAMEASGTLTLRTRNLEPDRIEVKVEDTGAGMAKEVLARALEPFYTTKGQQGTGLGLAIVYSTVKAHQGQLELHSEPGRGTCVVMRFPALAVPARPEPPAAVRAAGAAARALKVLVVDDDEMIRLSMDMLLTALGHSVTLAASGEAALDQLAAGAQPDLVILDLNMPGLGGGGTLPLLRAFRPTLPVLVATGRVEQTALDLVAADPHAALLAKPFSLEEVRAKLATASCIPG